MAAQQADVFESAALQSLSVRELRDLARERKVSTVGFAEKGDFVEALVGLPVALPSAAPELLAAGVNRAKVAGLDCISMVSEASGGADLDLLVVVLHGYGASSQDLFPLAQQLIGVPAIKGLGKVAFVHPNGLLDLGGGSAAWWNINMQELMAHVMSGNTDALFVESPEGLSEARQAVLALVDELRAAAGNLPLEKVVLAGFSQGGMLATDVVLNLEKEANVGGLCVFSGVAIARGEWDTMLEARKARSSAGQLRVLQSHGTQDPILPYNLGEGLRDWLQGEVKASLEFISFVGGHTIGGDTLGRFAQFLANTASSL